MKKHPKTITVKFTEEDRRKAARYYDSCGCLLHTALHRMGIRVPSVGGTQLTINGRMYDFESHFEDFEIDSNRKPYWKPEVVGMKVKLILRK